MRELLDVKAGGTHNYNSALKVKTVLMMEAVSTSETSAKLLPHSTASQTTHLLIFTRETARVLLAEKLDSSTS
jgi:hypothetical protein